MITINTIEKQTTSILCLKAVLLLSALFFATVNTKAQHQQKVISPLNQVLENIKPPEFKKTTYNITAFGAVADGQTDTKAVFDKVINLCSVNGGGQVIVPKGAFFIAGPIVLKSHVNLHFEDGAELIFSATPNIICLP